MYALNLNKETNRILSATYSEYASTDSIIVDYLPDGNISDYIYWVDENLDTGELSWGYDYEPLPEPVPTVEQQIASLKAELSATDYKIIKCSEAQLVGEELPYDIVTLHTERQAIRDRINELESGEV